MDREALTPADNGFKHGGNFLGGQPEILLRKNPLENFLKSWLK